MYFTKKKSNKVFKEIIKNKIYNFCRGMLKREGECK